MTYDIPDDYVDEYGFNHTFDYESDEELKQEKH